MIRFQQVRIHTIIALLRKVCERENVKAEFEALEHIAVNSRGDVRSAINDLQSLADTTKTLTLQDTTALSARNKDVGMEETLWGYFSAKSLQEASMLLSHVSVDADDLLMVVGDNLPRRYRNPEDLAEAYDFVSRADVYRGRIGVENWQLLKYFFNSLAEAAAVSPGTYKPFELISPPLRIMALFWTKGKRNMLDSICAKIGARCHVSRAMAKTDFVPFLQILLAKRKVNAVVAWLELQPEEVELLTKMDKL
jgi:replication factor C large subunit